MKPRKELLQKSQLYLILSRQPSAAPLLKKICLELCDSGIDIIQLRDKLKPKREILNIAFDLAAILNKKKTLFIINDWIEIALACEADGVHLGQDDCSIGEARKILGENRLIGVSCHSLSQALAAQRQGADYIGIGPVFPTPTKPEYKPIGLEELKSLKSRIKIPYFAIGDINEANIKSVILSGSKRVAVCRAILEAKDPKGQAARLKKFLKK